MPTKTSDHPHLDRVAELRAELEQHPKIEWDHHDGPLRDYVDANHDALIAEKVQLATDARDRMAAAVEELEQAFKAYDDEMRSWRRPFGTSMQVPAPKISHDRQHQLSENFNTVSTTTQVLTGTVGRDGLRLPLPYCFDPEETARAQRVAKSGGEPPRIAGFNNAIR
jgi:3',5'-cyclic AMP phosphodiesterase CpdA